MKLIRKTLFVMIITVLLYCSRVLASTGTINVSATRLREEPNTTSEILTNLYEDDNVDIIGEEGEWYKVNYKNKTGFIKKEFVKVSSKSNSSGDTSKDTAETNKSQTTDEKNQVNNEKNSNTNIVNNQTENSNSINNTNQISAENNQINNQTNTTTNTNTNNQTENNVQSNDLVTDENKGTNQITITTNTDLRVLPSFMSKKIGSLEAGKSFEKIAEINNWIQISDNNVDGWILKSKTSLENSGQPVQNDNTNTAVTNENITNVVDTNTISNNTSETNTVTVDNRSNVNSDSASGKTGKVNVETARVREKADGSAEIIDGLDYGTTVNIIAEEGDWYKIKSGNIEGYISKKLITLSDSNITSRSLPEARENQNADDTTIKQEQNNDVNKALSTVTSASGKGVEVVETAKKYLGYSYVAGGKTPQTGFDCSGFTRYVYSNFGYSLGGSAASQVGSGTEVSRDNLQVGDLILFYNDGKTKVGHTGIYMGDGNFIHAANPSRGVVTDNLNTSSYYNTRFVTARRIVE